MSVLLVTLVQAEFEFESQKVGKVRLVFLLVLVTFCFPQTAFWIPPTLFEI